VKPRILRVDYVSVRRPRHGTAFMKVPYGGIFGMSEVLARMVATEQIRWYRVAVATPAEIAEHRESLERWLPALVATSARTGVDWTA
jgi:hypothetical protein